MYQYVQRMPKKDNGRFSLPGRAIQKLFELFVNSKQFSNGSKWLYENVAVVFYNEYKRYEATTTFLKGEEYEDVLHEVVDMIPNCYDLFIKKKWNYGKISSEIRFQTDLTGSISLMGDMDFLIETKTETILMDFKSTAKGLSGIDKEQLLIYNHLYKSKYGKYPDQTYFFLCRDNQLVRVTIKDDEMEALISKLVKVGEGIQNEDYHKVPSKENCGWCPYKKSCFAPEKPPW